MQLIVPFAGVLSEAGRHAAQSLSLPHLEQLLVRSQPLAPLGSDEHSWSAPHELALAQALGWALADRTRLAYAVPMVVGLVGALISIGLLLAGAVLNVPGS